VANLDGDSELAARFRAGEIDAREINAVNAKLAPSAGTCMVMGTASTMACVTEALGMMLPGGACTPAVMSERMRNAEATSARAVAIAKEGLTPDKIMTPDAFENALTMLLAIGGSTNALVHLIALARRAGIPLTLDRFDELSRTTPLIANIRPAGKYLMEDFFYAGGLKALLATIGDKLALEIYRGNTKMTVTVTLGNRS